ncbi:glycosyltransferase family 32 protein [Lutibacter aestuarii]|uniref:Glycosyltransferase family 32 protein n=1 Tax=Lutibacter aestuarii TaxID=861111 RepID=A0ABW2Z645_9FLAO
MIPKKLHYCWFGSQPKPTLFKQCLKSWKQYCPNFEIIEWNELNSKAYQNKFYKDAIRKKKYAFAADSVRTKILYELGGIYIDTDMLLLKPLDDLLEYNFFTGLEVANRPAFGLFGAISKHPILKKMNQFYDCNEFNEFSLPVITHTFKNLVTKKSLKEKDIIFDTVYFYALPYQHKDKSFKSYCTSKSYAVHLWNHSWNEEEKSTTSISYYLVNLKKVWIDYLFYGYSKAYLMRYTRGFLRKIYYVLKGIK